MVGLKDIHTLTSTGKYRLQVDLKGYHSCWTAVYDNFQVMQYVWNFLTIHAGCFTPPTPAWKNMKHDDHGDGVGEVDNDGMKL